MSLPSIHATGRITATPELRQTHSGVNVCHVRLACVERRRDRAGVWQDGTTTYLDVDLLGVLAPALVATLSMGDLVVATGTLRQREVNGSSHYVLRADSLGRIPDRSAA